MNHSCLVCVCMFCVDHVCTTTRSFFSTTSFCPCFVFRTKVNVCSPGSNPNTVKVTFPTPSANKDFQLQLVECSPVPRMGCDCIRQSAGPAISITQYWQQSRGTRGLQTLWKSIMLNIVARYRNAVRLLVIDRTRQLQLLSSDHLIRNRNVNTEWQTDGHLNRICHTNP